MINPGNITTSAILQYVREGKLKKFMILEMIEERLWKLKYYQQQNLLIRKFLTPIPEGVVLGGIVRDNKLIFPDENTTIFVKDKLILFSDQLQLKKLKIFEVNIEFLMETYYVNGSSKKK